MAAAQRLTNSLRRIRCGNGQNENRLKEVPPNYTCSGNHDMNVEEELAKLQPSQRLLDHYREKVARFGSENQQLEELLHKLEKIAKPTFGEQERQQMTRELVELRSALSDVNIFIHAERQQVIRLHGQNERLKLDNLEAEKKVALLLSLTGLTEGELKVFLRDPRRTVVISQKLPAHLRKLQQKLKDDIKEPEISELEVELRTRIRTLEEQLEEAEKTWVTKRNALLQDRSLTAAEHKTQSAKEKAHINLLNAKIEETNRYTKEAVADSLKKTAQFQEQSKQWLAERDHLLSVLSTVQENIPLVTHMETIQRSGSYSNLTKAKSTCELKDLRRENETLRTEVKDAEDLRHLYESQCIQLEQTMCKLREDKEASEKLFKERNQKLLRQLEMQQQNQKRLDERRRTDLRGFQSDMRLLKNDIKTVVQQLYKVTMSMSNSDVVPVDMAGLSELQAVSTLVRAVQKSIHDTKRNLFRLEGDINTQDS